MDKLKYKYYEQEYMWLEVKKCLQNQDMRQVYRIMNVTMPPELKNALEYSGAVFWEKFAKNPTRITYF